jgi:hypothetical protein
LHPSLNHLVGAQQDSRGYRHAKRFGSLEVDHTLERCRPLNWEIAGLFSVENSCRVDGKFGDSWRAGSFPSSSGRQPPRIHAIRRSPKWHDVSSAARADRAER